MSKCMYRSIIHNLLKTGTQFGNLREAKDLNVSAMREYLILSRSTTTISFLATKSIQSSSRGNLRENALTFFQILSNKYSLRKCMELRLENLYVDGVRPLALGQPLGIPVKKKMCHVAAAWKRSHQWCVSLTPNNTKTIGRMTCHCFLLPIRRDLTSSSYTTHFLSPTGAGWPFYVVIWAT